MKTIKDTRKILRKKTEVKKKMVYLDRVFKRGLDLYRGLKK